MQRALMVAGMLLGATVALAATPRTPPDYSRATILKILHERDIEEAPFKIDIGQIQFRTRSMRYRFAYLPLLAPLPYSGPYGAGKLPNPFVLTGTEYAWRPGQYVATPDDYERSFEYRREYRRVARMLKKQRVIVRR